ncbi:MAG: YbaK/EbsC family protein [Candidatus Doudnabacteria bacterium]|nr:YbaK/EbsC family protein [Candidatus Doudnabacteria bacterium]
MNEKTVAKTVLIKADKDYALVIVPAAKHVDFSKVKKTLKAKKVSMAKESDMAKVLKTKIGLAHPFGNLYKLAALIDNSLLKQKTLIASAGSYTESIEIKPKDYEKLVQSTKGSFSK